MKNYKYLLLCLFVSVFVSVVPPAPCVCNSVFILCSYRQNQICLLSFPVLAGLV